jgi:hypothetical protein
MTNEEIYALFRAQDKYLKFSVFLEECIEWTYEDDSPKEQSDNDSNV